MFDKRVRTALALLLAFALLATFALTGCSSTSDDGADEGDTEAMETVKIGVHTSLTGRLADYGAAATGGLKLAAEDFSGFEIDGTKYEIELIIKDDKGEEAEAAVVAQQLIDEGVVGVVGALTSGATNAALPIYQEAGLPVISGSATNPDLTDGTFENFFRTCLRDDLQGQALGEWAVELGAEKVVVMDDRGDYAVGLGDIVQDDPRGERRRGPARAGPGGRHGLLRPGQQHQGLRSGCRDLHRLPPRGWPALQAAQRGRCRDHPDGWRRHQV